MSVKDEHNTPERVASALAFAQNIRDSEGEVDWKPIGFHMVALADEVEVLRAAIDEYVEMLIR